MKRSFFTILISLLLTAVMALSLTAAGHAAQSGEGPVRTGGDLVDPDYPLFEYVVLDDGTAKITFFQAWYAGEVTVPARLGGHKVTEIGTLVFRFDDTLTKIIFPDTLRVIDRFASSGCSNLKQVIIPTGVTTIEEGAFYGAISMTEVEIPSSVTSIGELAFGYYYDQITKEEDLKMPSLTIISSAGSAAQAYANDNGFTFRESSGIVETPVVDPGEDPYEDPGEDPYEDPGEDPYEDPGEDPYEDPGEDPYEDPGEIVSLYVGDVNNDGRVDNRDAMILDRFIAGWSGYDRYIADMDAADVSGDGRTDNRDAMILDRYVAGWDGYDRYIKWI